MIAGGHGLRERDLGLPDLLAQLFVCLGGCEDERQNGGDQHPPIMSEKSDPRG
jgi:hypothetical protein